MTQLHDLSALEQAAAVRSGETSSKELVDHYTARIEQLDGDIGAFVTLTFDQAREQAAAADSAVATGDELPPLHGVPIGIKALNMPEGVPTKLGSRAFEDFVPPFSDFTVEKLRAAGTISLGKTNTPEFGLPCYSETEVGPPARTPWDLTRSAGGSSGGAGAAVAAGLLPLPPGRDRGGAGGLPSHGFGPLCPKGGRGRAASLRSGRRRGRAGAHPARRVRSVRHQGESRPDRPRPAAGRRHRPVLGRAARAPGPRCGRHARRDGRPDARRPALGTA